MSEDTAPAEAGALTRGLPAFTPVPRQCKRHDGWTPQRQRRFIEALADTGSVESACRAVAMSSVGAYQLRRHPEAAEFRAAWDAALDQGVRRLEDLAMDRALNGAEVPVYSYGKLVGSRTVYNDRLLMFILRNRAPERFAAGGGSLKGLNAIGKMEKRRLKRKWRKQWEAELESRRSAEEAAQPSPGEVRASLARKIEALRQQVREDNAGAAALWRRFRPDTRAAFLAWEELRCRDLGRAFRRPAWTLDESVIEVSPEPCSAAPTVEETPTSPPPGWGRKPEPEPEPDPYPRWHSPKDEGWD